ncbi:hypothetical protein E2542_SST13838 [Spatholobus suberectus]|nr:hypothetical protein E2542_SST13838 [Spatholobus suberectus]
MRELRRGSISRWRGGGSTMEAHRKRDGGWLTKKKRDRRTRVAAQRGVVCFIILLLRTLILDGSEVPNFTYDFHALALSSLSTGIRAGCRCFEKGYLWRVLIDGENEASNTGIRLHSFSNTSRILNNRSSERLRIATASAIQQLNRRSATNLHEREVRGGGKSEEDVAAETRLAGEEALESDVESFNPFLDLVLEVLPRHLLNVLDAELLYRCEHSFPNPPTTIRFEISWRSLIVPALSGIRICALFPFPKGHPSWRVFGKCHWTWCYCGPAFSLRAFSDISQARIPKLGVK